MTKTNIRKFFDLIEKHQVRFVDFRFTDTKGKWQHKTQYITTISEKTFENGIMFDGSSIAHWRPINKSDMILMPDPDTAIIDPFTAHATLIVFCDVIDTDNGAGYEKDPRHTAKLAEKYLIDSGIGDQAFFGPELEFFIFDDVRYKTSMNSSFYKVTSEESPENTDTEYPHGNMGHRPGVKGGYFPVQPIDSTHDIRSEMLEVLNEIGLKPSLHHHEVAPSQGEAGFECSTLTRTADYVQVYKYVIHNVAHSYGKSATFMPKPIYGDNGSGMHVHQSVWKNNETLFAGNEYAGLSETALYYIGGLIKHAKTLNAFTNPSTNSYKRLIPGFEAPTFLTYSECNRSAAIRIPYVDSASAKRIEARFPDPTANPYLCFASMLMAGIDGIKNKIHPGEAADKDLYAASKEEVKSIPEVSRSLQVALEHLNNDREFLLAGGVFSNDQIDSYIELKMEEVIALNHRPHPVEFELHYSC